MFNFPGVGFSKDMIALFGGIRFRHMKLLHVDGMQLLLGACTETLETLKLYPTDPCGEQLDLKGMQCLANNFTARSSLLDFDLSRNKSLRTLEVDARSVVCGQRSFASELRTILSTITSPGFSEVIVFYWECDFGGTRFDSDHTPNLWKKMTPAQRAEEASWHRAVFEGIREMYAVRDFRLVLTVEVWDRLGEYAVGVVKQAVATEKAENRLDYLSSEPVVAYSPQSIELTYY